MQARSAINALLFSAVLCLPSVPLDAATYHGESATELWLGNDLVEIRFTRPAGALKSLRRKNGRERQRAPDSIRSAPAAPPGGCQ